MKKCVFYEITTVVSVYIFILIYTEKVFSKKQCMNIAYKNKLSHDCRVRTERMKVRFTYLLRPLSRYAGEIWNYFYGCVLLSTLIGPITELFENALQTRGSWKRRVLVFVWTKNILTTELFENDGVAIIVRTGCPTHGNHVTSLFLQLLKQHHCRRLKLTLLCNKLKTWYNCAI